MGCPVFAVPGIRRVQMSRRRRVRFVTGTKPGISPADRARLARNRLLDEQTTVGSGLVIYRSFYGWVVHDDTGTKICFQSSAIYGDRPRIGDRVVWHARRKERGFGCDVIRVHVERHFECGCPALDSTEGLRSRRWRQSAESEILSKYPQSLNGHLGVS